MRQAVGGVEVDPAPGGVTMGQSVVLFDVGSRDGTPPKACYSRVFGWEIDTDDPAGTLVRAEPAARAP